MRCPSRRKMSAQDSQGREHEHDRERGLGRPRQRERHSRAGGHDAGSSVASTVIFAPANSRDTGHRSLASPIAALSLALLTLGTVIAT